ncbi:DNA oxidative demethylase ALKBH2-like [Palaemon carinicauda]|uniref:DNA oxidative demethylase ALKBH2-like n=1 Tax=Palaemon carinicauda TaxID=392227 RepID=UPI0035B6373A
MNPSESKKRQSSVDGRKNNNEKKKKQTKETDKNGITKEAPEEALSNGTDGEPLTNGAPSDVEDSSAKLANGSPPEELSEGVYKGIDLSFRGLTTSSLKWRKIKRDNLDLDYAILFTRSMADRLFDMLEEEVEYFSGDLAKVRVFGKWMNIPRKQGTYGDEGLSYRYSGILTPARPWPLPLRAIRDLLARVTGHAFNFVLVNRYENGNDHMGEHKDDEKELDRSAPIASITLGQPRDFYFKHQDARGRNKKFIDKVTIVLEHGSLLMMNYPTNNYWYHALPTRKTVHGTRINLTFRTLIQKN